MTVDAHGHNVGGSHSAHGPEGQQRAPEWTDTDMAYKKNSVDDVESLQRQKDIDDSAAAQIIGVFILEFGVILHRYDLLTPFTVVLTNIILAFSSVSPWRLTRTSWYCSL